MVGLRRALGPLTLPRSLRNLAKGRSRAKQVDLPVITADLVVYGANIGGEFGSIKFDRLAQAAAMGVKVVIINDMPVDRAHGMMMAILNFDTDIARGKGVQRGIGNELFRRLANLYLSGGLAQETFLASSNYGSRPDFIKPTLDAMMAEHPNITFYHDEPLVSVQKSGTRITSLRTAKREYRATTYIDNHYCLDLAPAAGCDTFIGRESSAEFGESNAGIRPPTNAFSVNISPYNIPGNPASGLLYGIRDEAYGNVGDASLDVQAMAYRQWDYAAANTQSPMPVGYDASRYTLAKRNILARGLTSFAQVVTLYVVRHGNDVNSNGGSSGVGQAFNFTGPEIREYITATPARRKEIEKLVMEWWLGYLYFLRTDTDLPSAIRTGAAAVRVMNTSIWPNTPDYPGFNPNFYVRQGRLLRGDKVLTQQDVVNARPAWPTPDPYEAIQIGRITYAGDRHWSRTLVVDDATAVDGKRVVNEGGMAIATRVGEPIPAWVLWPKKSQCSNLLSTFGISASAIAHGSTRMEGLSMHFGEACAVLAFMQIKNPSLDIQDILGSFDANGNYIINEARVAEFRKLLDFWNVYDTNGGAVVPVPSTYPSPNVPPNVNGGTVTSTGTWTTPSGAPQFTIPFGSAVGQAGATKRFQPKLEQTGVYEVRLSWAVFTGNARNTATIVRVVHAGGTFSTTKNQNAGSIDTGDWGYVGPRPTTGTAAERDAGEIAASRFTFNAGDPSEHYVEIEVPSSGGTGTIAAVKFIKVA